MPHQPPKAVEQRALMSTTAMIVQDVAEDLSVDPKTHHRRVKRGDRPGVEAAVRWRLQEDGPRRLGRDVGGYSRQTVREKEPR